MLVRGFPKLIVFIIPLVIVGYLVSGFFSRTANSKKTSGDGTQPTNLKDQTLNVLPPSHMVEVDEDGTPLIDTSAYRAIYSNSTKDGKYFKIHLGTRRGFNPSIIAHPTQYDAWIVVTQELSAKSADHSKIQSVCSAKFYNGVLTCTDEPVALPVEHIEGGSLCKGDLSYMAFAKGPRDARAFYGPSAPYLSYGSLASYTCLSQYIQDLRLLAEDFGVQAILAKEFRKGTELRRPSPYQDVEKNYFIFWDRDDKMYVHFDIWPQRSFAQLSASGVVGLDLAQVTAGTDEICTSKYFPPLPNKQSAIHQASNSLAITMCQRSDPDCHPTADNTFIMFVFHYKSEMNYHSMYEPYVMLFRQTAPFAIYAISAKPLWINGRTQFTKESGSVPWANREHLPENHSEMFYITSMSWKSHGQKYHGYIDDIVFVGFGIEDSRSAAIDVVASDLLQDLRFC